MHDSRLLQRIYVQVGHEPRSKKSLKPDQKIAFQSSAAEGMKRLKLQPLRGPIVVDMTFDPVAPNPPSIEKLPKSYLDLLERRVKPDGTFSQDHLVFRDDRQVKVLLVQYDLGLTTRPGVHATIVARRHLLADLELARRIESDDFLQSATYRFSRSRVEGSRIFAFQSEFDRERAFAEIHDLESQPRLRQQLGKAYDDTLLVAYHEAQRIILADNDRAIGSSLAALFPLWKRTQPPLLAELLKMRREMLMSRPLSYKVMHVPRRDGDNALFGDAVRRAVAELQADHPLLFPLRTQLAVTIFYVPPMPGSPGSVGKDLDNLARLLISRVQELCKPPSTLWHTFRHFEMTQRDPETLAWAARQLDLHKRLPGVAVVRYLAVELPRVPGDPVDGMVTLAFGGGQQEYSFLGALDRFIDEWKDDVR